MSIRSNKAVKYAVHVVYACVFAAANRAMGLLPLHEDRVLFASDVRSEMGGNFAFVEEHMPKRLQARYDLKGDRRDRRGLKKIFEMIYNMSTCKYIILEDYFTYTSYMHVRKGQQICQLWHAAGAYKKFGWSRAGNNEGIRIHKGYKKYAKAIVSADPIRKDYAEAFSISMDKVQATGVPRTDIFFDEKYIAETKESIYEEYPMLREKKVILFAPTYRGLRAEDAAYNFDMLDPDRLYEALGDDYVFVLKWHPATYNNLKREEKSVYHLEKYNNFFLDLSQERDINDLLLVADVMITDYSSVIFDYFLCHKPIIYYTFDLEEYEGGRGIYYDFEEYVYGPVARDLDTLIADIKEAKVDEDSRRAFNEKFMAACDGHATERTCAWLFDDVLPEDFVPAESPAKEDK